MNKLDEVNIKKKVLITNCDCKIVKKTHKNINRSKIRLPVAASPVH